jgi:hypothetical protein
VSNCAADLTGSRLRTWAVFRETTAQSSGLRAAAGVAVPWPLQVGLRCRVGHGPASGARVGPSGARADRRFAGWEPRCAVPNFECLLGSGRAVSRDVSASARSSSSHPARAQLFRQRALVADRSGPTNSRSYRAEIGHFTRQQVREKETTLIRFPWVLDHAIKGAVIVVSGAPAF